MDETEISMKLTKNNLSDGGGQLAFRLAAVAFLALAARPLLCATPPQLSDVRVALDSTNRTVNVTVAFEADGEPVGDRSDSFANGDVNRVVAATRLPEARRDLTVGGVGLALNF